MCKKILSFLLVGICLIATLTPIRALENSEDIGLTCDYAVAIDKAWKLGLNGTFAWFYIIRTWMNGCILRV